MIDKFNSSLFQSFGSLGVTKIGMVITTAFGTDVWWLWFGRLAIVLGALASMVALLNGLRILVNNLKNDYNSMKTSNIFKTFAHVVTELWLRMKAETPSFLAKMARFYLVLGITALLTWMAEKYIGLDIAPIVREILSYVVVGCLFGYFGCTMAVKDSSKLYEELSKRTGIDINDKPSS